MVLGALLLLACACAVRAENVQVEFFTSATLNCDNNDHNLTTVPSHQSNVKQKYWITPLGSIISNESVPETTRKGGPAWALGDLFLFNLTVNYVDDEDFGVYYCVIVSNDYSIIVIKQGLNENGPSYERLYERYRYNAMVGGIAAATLFCIIFTFCVVSHCRYSKKNKYKEEGLEEVKKGSDNNAYEMQDKDGINSTPM